MEDCWYGSEFVAVIRAGLLILTTDCYVQADEERIALNFAETFVVMREGQGGYWVMNDMFRWI